MSVSTRLSIHWPKSEPVQFPEQTDTLVLTTPKGDYLDVRAYKQPCGFPFEWAFAGEERVVRQDPLRLEFTHQFLDSTYILQYCSWKSGKGEQPDRSKIPVDSGDFVTLADGIREETGEMLNGATGQIEPYIEHWMSLDPLDSNMTQLDESAPQQFEVSQFDVHNSRFEGRFIRLGVWAQGLLWDKSDTEHPMSVVRRSKLDGEWVSLIEYGNLCSALELQDSIGDVTIGEVSWICKS